jgi:sugar phosphate isomerase/epimerase
MGFQIGLQLYSVREPLAAEFIGGLEKVAEIGYEHVEFAGFGDLSPRTIADALQRLDIRAAGAHVPAKVFDNPEAIIDDIVAIGAANATMPGLPESMRSSLEDWKESARSLEEVAKAFSDNGLTFGYHNHAFEFDSQNGFEIILRDTRILKFQLDVFWAAKAGKDPVSLIRLLGGRLQSLHCKDLAPDGRDVEVGDGVLDWPAILSAAASAGVTMLIVEMDNPRGDAFESAENSLLGLTKHIEQYEF